MSSSPSSGAGPGTVPGDWIAYVGPVPFPWGSASARRVLGVCQSLALADRRVVVVSGSDEPTQLTTLPEPWSAIGYVGVGELLDRSVDPVRKLARMMVSWGRRTVAWLDAAPVPPTHVICYGGFAAFALRIQRWAARRGVPVIQDVVEWYDPRQLAGGRYGPLWPSSELALRRVYPRAAGVIAISEFLESYYAAAGVPTVVVPPTLDVPPLGPDPAAPAGEGVADRLEFVYFGVPGPKDRLAPVVRALARLDPEGRRARLRILGPDRATVLANVGTDRLPPGVEIVGPVPQDQVAAQVRAADLSVLLRPVERFTTAGFPTKFVESLAAGTGVLGTLTSDLGRYLVDGTTGIVVSGLGDGAVTAAVDRALGLSGDERRAMRVAAHAMATRSFDVRRYSDPLEAFLHRVGGR